MAQTRRFKYAFFLLFRPERFVQASTERIVELRTPRHEGPFTERDRADAEAVARTQARNLRHANLAGIAVALLTIAVAGLAGWLLRRYFAAPSKITVSIFQAGGASILLGATFAQMSRRHLSMGGETLADEMNDYMFKALCMIGTFLIAVSLTWDA